MSTGDQTIYRLTVTMDIISKQGTTEGDETIVNAILDQILEFVEDEQMLIMDNFKCDMSNIEGVEDISEMDEANFIVGKKLNMLNIIEQK